MNVIGSRPDGWWRDRAGAARKLTAALEQLAAARDDDEVIVAFEGGEIPDLPPGRRRGVEVVYARRRGPNAADDRIVEQVAADQDPGSLTVVTADRDLSRRVQDLGASVVGPSVLRQRLESLAP